jgi:hypothetical protein
MKKKPYTLEFEVFLRDKTAVEIANLLTGYLMENNHQGWDGFTSHHLTGIRMMFKDIMLYYVSVVTDSRNFKGDPPSNGLCSAYLKDTAFLLPKEKK